MFEKVNIAHPDKVADRIAGAIVDLAYTKQENPKIAVEVLLGHGDCKVIIETSVLFEAKEITAIVHRIAGNCQVDCLITPQDPELAKNQETEIRCGDNGIFKGMPTTIEQNRLVEITKMLYKKYPSDGKYIIYKGKLIICQSNAKSKQIAKMIKKEYGMTYTDITINPLGEWTGGTNVDCGATNRKLGSDMGDAVTGGGLHGKDLSKADVSVNIYCHLLAQKENKPIFALCAIGDKDVLINGKKLVPFKEIVEIARNYIQNIGGFEKFAEYGLIN